MSYRSILGMCLGLSLLCLPVEVSADDAFQWQVSAGAFHLDPSTDSDVIYASGMPVPGAKFDIQDLTASTLLVSRKLTNDWSLQTLLSQPADFTATLSGIAPQPIEAANLSLVPLILMANYSPDSWQWGNFRPNIGIGATYIYVKEIKVSDQLNAVVNPGNAGSRISLDDQKQLLLTFGLDYALDNRWTINYNFIHFRGDTTLEGVFPGLNLKTQLSYAPLVHALSIGYRF